MSLSSDNRRLVRAMPMERMIAHGMIFDDCHEFAGRLRRGEAWVDILSGLGRRHHQRAIKARARHVLVTAEEEALAGAACFRFAHTALEQDTSSKRALHQRAVEACTVAMTSRRPAGQLIAIPGRSRGWLLPATDSAPRGACVVIFGGVTGWGDSYELSSRGLLKRGIDCALVDLPGQGAVRFDDGCFFVDDSHQVDALRAVAAELQKRGYTSIGFWGNSVGAYWSLLAAACIDTVSAACGVSGSWRPAEFLARFPGALANLSGLMGRAPSPAVQAELLNWSWPAEVRLGKFTMLLSGSGDVLYPIESAHRLASCVEPALLTLQIFENQPHGLYAIHTQKVSMIADWFASCLERST